VELRHVAPDIAALLEPDGASNLTLVHAKPLANALTNALANSQDDPRDERARIVDALTRHQWRPNAAAQALGISRATLYRRIAKLGIVGPHRG
jgi:transcriptional regulator of acetoin/glycerol metabolism